MEIIEEHVATKKLVPMLKPFLVNRLPEIKKLRERERKAAKLFESVLKQREVSEKNDPNYEKPSDAMQWMVDRTPQLIFVAVHTTTATGTNILYTIGCRFRCPSARKVQCGSVAKGLNIDSGKHRNVISKYVLFHKTNCGCRHCSIALRF